MKMEKEKGKGNGKGNGKQKKQVVSMVLFFLITQKLYFL